jgi:hypothetical protein
MRLFLLILVAPGSERRLGRPSRPTIPFLSIWTFEAYIVWSEINARLTAAFEKFTPAQWLEKHTSMSEEDFARADAQSSCHPDRAHESCSLPHRPGGAYEADLEQSTDGVG